MMSVKQISLTIPEGLFQASTKHCSDYGYKNMQEFILDLMRTRVLLENAERYRNIESRMKKGIGVKRFTQKGAVHYLRGI